MSMLREDLDVGWQSRIAVAVSAGVATVVASIVAGVVLGPMVAVVVVLAMTLAVMSRVQWAAVDGPALQLRDATTGYAYRLLPARQVACLRYRRTRLPWCRLRVEADRFGVVLVLSAPSSSHATARAITMWLIVHGRRRTRIDAPLLDALAGMPEHGPARQPHDASPA
ncbi:hypothetical protein [Lysobacter sp. HA18]